MIPETKKCSKCQQVKNKDGFYPRKSNGYTYLKSYCKECDKVVARSRSGHRFDKCECGNKKNKKSAKCQECVSAKDITLLEAKLRYKSLQQSNAYSLIRWRARQKYNKVFTCCSKCGYDKHFEVCHIKPISSFSDDTLLSQINDISNIIALCPNCHWEFDNLK